MSVPIEPNDGVSMWSKTKGELFDPRLTLQQIIALESLASRANDHGVDIGPRDFGLRFEDFGGVVHGSYVDGDYALAFSIDPYGHGSGLYVAEVLSVCDGPAEQTDLLCDDCQAAEDKS